LSNTSHISASIVSSPDRSTSCSRDETLVQLLTAATATFDSDRDRAKACVQQAAELLRVSLEREGYLRNETSSRGGLAPWQVKRLDAYIESYIGLSLRVADLAGIVQLSIGHFSRAFSASFGRPPFAYVTARRIRHAQVILLSTRESIAQVALDCGMYDQAHFTRVFRKVVGISPSLWRRQFQSQPMSADPMQRQATHEVSRCDMGSSDVAG
jgi:AraC family transcriptional regulator